MDIRKLLGSVLLSALLIAGAAYAFLHASPSPAASKYSTTIQWAPKSVEEEIAPGETKSLTVTITALSATPSSSLRIVPELEPYVSVSPTTLGPLAKGQSASITLTIHANADALPAEIEGTIQLRQADKPDKTLANPLPVEIGVVWPRMAIQDAVVDIAYPPTWITRDTSDGIIFSNVAESSDLSDDSLQKESFFQVAIEKDRNQLGLPVSDWFNRYLRPVISDILTAESYITIDGHQAVQAVVSELGGSRVHIYIVRNTDVIEISYGLFAPQFVGTYSAMVQSIQLAQ